jgi:hypothetical protein
VTENWLARYLVRSVQKNLCTKIYCTTCGGKDFRRGMLRAFTRATGQKLPLGLLPDAARAIAVALAGISFGADYDRRLDGAVRCLVFELACIMGESEASTILDGTWAGDVLRGMQQHDSARLARQRALDEYNGPAAVQKRREEKKCVKQVAHEQRRLLKEEHDGLWHENQDKPKQLHPDLFAASIGGYTGDSYAVEWKDGQLRYRAFGLGHRPKRTQRKAPCPSPVAVDWQAFWDELDKIGTWDWKANYREAGVVDGTGWSVEITYNGRELKSHGSNAYPSQFDNFLKAIQKLVGGRRFR